MPRKKKIDTEKPEIKEDIKQEQKAKSKIEKYDIIIDPDGNPKGIYFGMRNNKMIVKYAGKEMLIEPVKIKSRKLVDGRYRAYM